MKAVGPSRTDARRHHHGQMSGTRERYPSPRTRRRRLAPFADGRGGIYDAVDKRRGGGVDAAARWQRRSAPRTYARRKMSLRTSGGEGGAPPAAIDEVAGRPRQRPVTMHRVDSHGWMSLQMSGKEGGARSATIVSSARTSARGGNVTMDDWWVSEARRMSPLQTSLCGQPAGCVVADKATGGRNSGGPCKRLWEMPSWTRPPGEEKRDGCCRG